MKLSEWVAKAARNKYGIDGLGELYPFKINGLEKVANGFDELLGYAIYDYATIQIDDDKYFAKQEQDLINEVIKYQKLVGAVHEPLKYKNITPEAVEQYSHTQVRHMLNRKARHNSGIYYIPTLLAYTSTHLYEQFLKQPGTRVGGGCNYNRIRKYGSAVDVITETLRLFDGTEVFLRYPYKLKNGYKQETDDKEVIYMAILESKAEIDLVHETIYYSRQTKRNIKYVQKLKSDGFITSELYQQSKIKQSI